MIKKLVQNSRHAVLAFDSL